MVKTIDKSANTDLMLKNGKPIPPGRIRDEKGRIVFAPGSSGNPSGKKKGTKHFSTLLLEIIKEQVEITPRGEKKSVKMRVDRAMSLAMVKKAIMEGDVSAFNAITNRTDGLPAQSIEMEVSTPPVPIYSGKSLVVKAKDGNNRRKKKI